MTKKIKILGSGILIIAAVAAIAVISLIKPVEKTVQPLLKLKVGGHTTMLSAVLEVAQSKGFFQQEGLDVQIERIESSKITLPALEKGELDIIIASRSAGTFNALAKSPKLQIIADAARVTPVLLVRKDLADQIKTISDLKEKSIATPREGSASQYALVKILESASLTIKDISAKSLDQQPAVAALEAKNLDAGIINEPFATIAINKGIANALAANEIKKIFPAGQQNMILLSTTDVLNTKTEAIKKFFIAYKKAAQYYNQGKTGQQPQRQEVIKIVADYTNTEQEIVDKSMWIEINNDLKPDIVEMTAAQDWYFANGLLDQKIDLTKKTDFNFLPPIN
ncbi:MAG: ABC transporter substrate-binding protein [Patescibacteria group bacterium]